MDTKQTLALAKAILATDEKSTRDWYDERSKITYVAIIVDCPPHYRWKNLTLLNYTYDDKAYYYNISQQLHSLNPDLCNLPEYTLIVNHLKKIMFQIGDKHAQVVERRKNVKPKTINYLPVLNSTIPQGGFGRNLTEGECSRLRKLGHKISRRWIVVRAFDSSELGILYHPVKPSGFSHAGIYVTTK